MIRIESLSARFGDFRLRDVTLQVPAGASLAVLGPSGAGKSLLLETTLGLRPMQRGRVLIGGHDVSSLPPERRGVSYLPQDLALFPHLSVQSNIQFGAQGRRAGHDADQQMARLARLLNITHLLDRQDVRSLSGGEAQRVALARALLTRPRVVFLDECFNCLDAPLRRQLREEFRHLQRSLGLTVFLVTHDQEEAFLLGDLVAVLMEGRLVQVDKPERLYARPVSVRVARFLGITNILPLDRLVIADSQAVCRAGSLQLSASLPSQPSTRFSHVGFADGELRVLDESDASASASDVNTFQATIRSATNLGHRWQVLLQVAAEGGATLSCSVPHSSVSPTTLQPDRVVTVQIDRSSVRLLQDSAD